MTNQSYLMSGIREMYPDQWVIIDGCERENKSTVKSAVIVEVCSNDEISEKRMMYRHQKCRG